MVKIIVDSREANLMQSIVGILNEQDCYYALNFTSTGVEISTKDLILPIIIPEDYVGDYKYSPEGTITIKYIFQDDDEFNHICTILNRWGQVYSKYEKLKNRKDSVISIMIMDEKIPMLKFLNLSKS